MKCRVALIFDNIYLGRKVELILRGKAIFTDREHAELILTDDTRIEGASVITIGRGAGYRLKVPFSDEELISLLPRGAEKLVLSMQGERVFLGEKEIRLTELERALFERLYRARGEFVARERLRESFAEGVSDGMLNVYIHYLREKLEGDGMRVILSSRKLGYGIDKKFFSGVIENA